MAAIHVRQLDDEVVARLKQRASSNNRSLEGEVRHILECAAADDMAAKRARFLEASDRLREKTRAASRPRRSAPPRGPRPRPSRRFLMRFVVDASVAVKLLVDEPDSDAARKLAASGQELHAPRLMASEAANVLWRKARVGEIQRAEAGASMASLGDMPVRWNDDETVGADAVRLALALEHPVYDCMYLALAHRIGATVVTADRRFVAAVAPTEHGEAVMTLADYADTR